MSFAPVAIGLTLVSGAISAMGAIQAGQAQAAAAQYEAQIAERNAKLADQDRILAVQTSQQAAEDKRRDNTRQLAAIRAAYGSSGFELAGTPLDVLSDTSVEMALDERRIEFEGQVKNREGALQMLYYNEDAQLSRFEGKNAKRASYMQAGASLLSSGSDAYRISRM